MARKFEDLVEEEVRRRLAERLASAGLAEGRLSLEVLYMLPPEFVREYTELFQEALLEDLAGSGQGMGKDEGQIKSRAGVIKRTRGRAKRDAEGKLLEGSDRPAAGGQKKYKTHWVIRDEKSLEVKHRVDRALVRMIQSKRREVGSGVTEGRRDGSGRFRKEA